MSEPQTSTRSGWLTVSQAAAALGVSEKTVRKRIANGEIKAEKVKLSAGGWAWRVEADRLEAPGTIGSVTEAVGSRDGTLNEREPLGNRLEVPTASNRATEVPTAKVPSVPGDEMAVALVSQLQSENAFLRTQIEAANRQAAEATAALREYLKMQAKALPEPSHSATSSTRHVAETSRENAPQLAQMAQAGKVTSSTRNAVKRERMREMRPLWKVILGVR